MNNETKSSITLLVLNSHGGKNFIIIYCGPFRISKKLTGGLADQDQNLKRLHQHHTLFCQGLFLTRNIVGTTGKYYVEKGTFKCSNSSCPFIFFLTLTPFSKCTTESCPPADKWVI